MKRLRKILLPVSVLAVAGFLFLWLVLGPEPLVTGPSIQGLGETSALLCRLDAEPSKLQVVLSKQDGEPRIIHEVKASADHRILLDKLTPATSYQGELRSQEGEVQDKFSFRTPPSSDQAKVRFVTVGDSGSMPWWSAMHKFGWSRLRPAFAWVGKGKQWRMAELMQVRKPDFFVHLGDLCYSRDLPVAYGEAFYMPFGQLMRNTPMYPIIGNHDALLPSQPHSYFDDLFFFPPHPAGERTRCYSQAWGSLRLVVLDNMYQDWLPGSPLHQWLEQTLAQATEPWLVVACHYPFFSAGRHAENEELQKNVGSLLAKHGVDLVLAGHDHNYQRFKPIAGVTHIVVGGGGKSIYEVRDDPRLASYKELHGFLTVDVTGAKLQGEVRGLDDAIQDQFTLTKDPKQLPANAERAARIKALQ